MKKRLLLSGLLFLLCLFNMKVSSKAAILPDMDHAITTECSVTDTETVKLRSIFSDIPKSDDGRLYVYALFPYQYGLDEAELVADIPMTAIACASFGLYNDEFTRLYSKFVFAVQLDGKMHMVTTPHYITNPELLATHTRPRTERSLKSEQGVDFTNIWVGEEFPFITGVTTAQFMCTKNMVGTHYCSPLAVEPDKHPVTPMFYMLNGSTLEGIQVNAVEFKKYANVDTLENFIIGNEVNTRIWNYESWTSWEEYVRNYYQIFRVAYNAIKSENANARIFLSIDQYWDVSWSSTSYMNSKKFLEMFSEMCKAEGDIDWNLSHHSYPSPVNWSKFWDMSECPKGSHFKYQVNNDRIVTFQNLSVITDFLKTPEMLNSDGEMRHLIISEIGATRAQGVDVQAATMCAEYMAAKLNGYVEEITFLRIDGLGMYSKTTGFSDEMFDNMDREDEVGEEYRKKALTIIGANDWSDILR